jgi:hypothetical protein
MQPTAPNKTSKADFIRQSRICLRMSVDTHDKSNFKLRGSITSSLFDDLIVILIVNDCPYLCL